MGEIPATKIESGNVVRHFFESEFGLHKVEGIVHSVVIDQLTSGQDFYKVTLEWAICSDIVQHVPGAYLYSEGGLRMPNYSFGLMPEWGVLLLAEEATMLDPGEMQPYALPLKSEWIWDPTDGSQVVTVSVEECTYSDDGPWIKFADYNGNIWMLDEGAFHIQCKFKRLRRKVAQSA